MHVSADSAGTVSLKLLDLECEIEEVRNYVPSIGNWDFSWKKGNTGVRHETKPWDLTLKASK